MIDDQLPRVCGWRMDLQASQRGEFWVDREALTQVMSKLTPAQRSMFRWGIVEEFNRGLEEILSQDQAVGEMREDWRDR
jgi:hypothetical protein